MISNRNAREWFKALDQTRADDDPESPTIDCAVVQLFGQIEAEDRDRRTRLAMRLARASTNR